MEVPHHAHVLVIDGRKLLLFRNDGTPFAPELHVCAHDEQVSAATTDQGSDEPGKTQASVGSSRSDYEAADYHQMDEDAFAKAAAAKLRRMALAGKVKQLIVVAAPRTLGVLRAQFDAVVNKVLTGTIAKDAAGMTTVEIGKVIAAG